MAPPVLTGQGTKVNFRLSNSPKFRQRKLIAVADVSQHDLTSPVMTPARLHLDQDLCPLSLACPKRQEITAATKAALHTHTQAVSCLYLAPRGFPGHAVHHSSS